ncbi:MAG: methyltransferase domain-containing protein [Pseudomonadota bacterium]|jgi:SAM-dependent methyltransferase|uniref:methyltransferase domain-containing protein n=1 Tax=Aquabacterium sp. TaxID=1872578 RepID=UPI001D6940C1|nr:methyltransferase domain-containing protein [Aquabacterium sp.]MBT9611615.1 hypothetical protein [Aquabacterium sp.]
MEMRAVHICIVQPVGYVHSLGFLDQARYLRYQFRRLGAEVTLSKNRLRHDAVNVVFGAHLGFDAELRTRYSCIFVNLEQIGSGGASLSPEYLRLLASSAVFDYDPGNVAAYTPHVDDVPIITFSHAPYLAPAAVAIEDRPIDLLFFGSMNERRKRIIQQIEDAGGSVTVVNGAVYGPERDDLIRQAKAVLNCHYYESARFEQARVFQCLSLGTPVVSERLLSAAPPAQFEDAVFWVRDGDWSGFVREKLRAPDFGVQGRAKLQAFRQHDVIEPYADALVFALAYTQTHLSNLASGPWRPNKLHIGSGKDYKPGWLNVDILASAEPDVVLNLAQPLEWPLPVHGDQVGDVELCADSLDVIYANNVLEHVPDLTTLMGNCLTLLRDGGQMQIEVPYERANAAWQDPTHVRAMNENSWIYYADWFWYLGWFDRRFQVAKFAYLDGSLRECARDAANFMRVTLTKQATTLGERMTARTMQASFGGLPDDMDVFAHDDAPPSDVPETASQPTVVVGKRTEPSPAPWVLIYPAHDDGVTDNFSHEMAAALRAEGEAVVELNMSTDLSAQWSRLPATLSGVITIGALPLNIQVGGRPLAELFECPVYAYLLDSPIYDLARVPATRDFIRRAWDNEKLVPILAERSYLQLGQGGAQPLLPPQAFYLPFAAFTAPDESRRSAAELPQQQRILVIGALGQELSRAAIRQDLEATLMSANAPGLAHSDVHALAAAMMSANAAGNPLVTAHALLSLSGKDLFTDSMMTLMCAGDSFLKRVRRVLAVESLRGVPVDFIGPGWDQAFGDQDGFRFLGSMPHAQLPALMPLYRGVLNLDPNWDWGCHDRAYSAWAQGVPVMTHNNAAIVEERVPAAMVHAFSPNAPDLAAVADEWLARPAPQSEPSAAMLRCGWNERIRTLLTRHRASLIATEAVAS